VKGNRQILCIKDSAFFVPFTAICDERHLFEDERQKWGDEWFGGWAACGKFSQGVESLMVVKQAWSRRHWPALLSFGRSPANSAGSRFTLQYQPKSGWHFRCNR
jgi:hypothetical protein